MHRSRGAAALDPKRRAGDRRERFRGMAAPPGTGRRMSRRGTSGDPSRRAKRNALLYAARRRRREEILRGFEAVRQAFHRGERGMSGLVSQKDRCRSRESRRASKSPSCPARSTSHSRRPVVSACWIVVFRSTKERELPLFRGAKGDSPWQGRCRLNVATIRPSARQRRSAKPPDSAGGSGRRRSR